MPKLKEIHIGREIARLIAERQMSYASVARELAVNRTTMYSIVHSKSIDIERLIRLGDILQYDFIGKIYGEWIGVDLKLSHESLLGIFESEREVEIILRLKRGKL